MGLAASFRSSFLLLAVFVGTFAADRVRADSTVVLSEVMYHPLNDEAALEWVELHNLMAADMELSGWSLANGISYQFPDGTILGGGEFLVVAISPAALAAATGYSEAFGPFVGRLDNSGERIELRDGNGRTHDTMRYGVGGDWPVEADGAGVSLAKRNLLLLSEEPASWARSLELGGTPGRANFPIVDEEALRAEGLVSYWSFDEASGPALDVAGGNNGSLGSGVDRVVGFIGSGALRFDNTTSALVNVGDGVGDNFFLSSGVTIEALISPEWNADLLDYDEIFRKEDGSRRFLLALQHDDLSADRDVAIVPVEQPVLSFGLNVGGIYSELDMPLDGQEGRPSLADLQDGQPHHVLASYDAASGMKAIYFDGELAFSAMLGTNRLIASGGVGTAYIGNMSGRREPFTGVLDEVAIWERALGTEEISTHYANFIANRDYFVGGASGSGDILLAFNEFSLQDAAGAWVEIVYHGEVPVDLEGMVLVSQGTVAANYTFGPQILESGAYLVIDENELAFRLFAGNRLFLYTPGQIALVDGLRFKTEGRARHPEATGSWLFPSDPTPGETNLFQFHDEVVINEIMYHAPGLSAVDAVTELQPVLPIDTDWLYDASGQGQATNAWRQDGFDTQGWGSGAALLYNESSGLPAPKNTEIPLGSISYYFRTEFEYLGDTAGAQIQLRPVVDDGAVFYLNGEEIFRLRMPSGEISSNTVARTSVGNARYDGPFVVPAPSLVDGQNLLAVEVHQRTGASSDIVFGVEIGVLKTISEAQAHRDSAEAWVELHNRGDVAVDLSDWQLDEGIRFVFAQGTEIAARGYLLVAADAQVLRALYPDADIVGDFGGRLSHSNDTLILRDSAGNPADRLRYYDGSPWPEYPDGGGASLELQSPHSDNSRAESWSASDETEATEWQDFSYRDQARANIGPTGWREFVFGLLDAGEILIDDIRVVDSPDAQATEIVANGDFESGTSGWRILGNHSKSRVIVDPDNPGNRVLHLVASGATEHMHNHLETTLSGGASVINGRVYEISFRARWLAGSNQLNTRLYFNRVARTTILPRADLLGTPGRQNSRFVANRGPTYAGLRHAPVVPVSGEAVEVSVTIQDEDLVDGASLWYSVEGGAWNEIAMTPDGDVYRGSIPGQSSSRIVQFYVEAGDALGATSTFPRTGRDSRALYKVQDGQARLGTIHNLRMIMIPADRSRLFQNTNVMSNERLGATVLYDEHEVFYDAGIRLKGSERGRPTSNRVSFNIRFPRDKLFRGVHRTISIDRSGGWSGRGGRQDEIVLKHIANHAGGIPGMYDDICHVISPTSSHNGSAILMMAKFNSVYLDGQYENGSDGTKFKMELIYYPTTVDGSGLKRPQPDGVLGADNRDWGDDKEVYRWNWLIKNNRDQDDYSTLINWCKSMGSSGSQLQAATEQTMDLDQWMRAYALYTLGGVNDAHSFGNNHNIVYYVRPSDGKMLMFPWDMDFCWHRGTNSALIGGQNLARVVRLPSNLRKFYGHIESIIDSTYNTGYMSRWTNHYGSLAGDNYAGVLSYISARRNFALSQLPSPVAFAITTNSGNDMTVDTPTVVLEGDAGIDVQTIIVSDRDEPPPINWISLSRWQVEIPLFSGRNELTLFGFDFAGNLTASDSIDVTTSFGFPPPVLRSVSPGSGMPGAAVVIEGTGFEPGVEVFFDGVSAAVDFDPEADSSLLTAVVPSLPPGEATIIANNVASEASNELGFTILVPLPRFIRGDSNLDGAIDMSDAIFVLLHLFGGGEILCEDAADTDDNEALNLTDAVRILNYLFLAGAPPPPPLRAAGEDPDGDVLGCQQGIEL